MAAGGLIHTETLGLLAHMRERRQSLSKRVILILSIAAIVFYIVGFGAYLYAAGATATCANGASDSATITNCATGVAGAALIGLVGIVLGGICTLIAWIGGLIKTAQISRWGWFVLVLLLSPLGSLIYGFAGPETKAVA